MQIDEEGVRYPKHLTRIVTTSWDDGHPHDLRLMELLLKYGISGTFYIPIRNLECEVMNGSQIAEIARFFEIGGHTYNHIDLTKLTPLEAMNEISASRTELSDMLGTDIMTFCYPKGKHNRTVRKLVSNAGYLGGRTTRRLSTGFPCDPFCLSTSVQAYPHGLPGYTRSCLSLQDHAELRTHFIGLVNGRDWVRTSLALFDYVLKNGGVWHLWGHSWELDKLGLWSDLESLLSYVSSHSLVLYYTVAELVQLTKQDR